MKKTKDLALCAVSAALSIVLMLAGAMLGIGTYAAPLLSGITLIPAGIRTGRKYHAMMFLCVAALSALLISDYEQTLMFACFFGWYPILRPSLEKIRMPVRMIVKLLIFNAVIIGAEWLLMAVLVPQSESTWLLILLLAMANFLFLLYDRLLPGVTVLLCRRLKIHPKI